MRGYLVNTPLALRVLFARELTHPHFHSVLARPACVFFVLAGISAGGFLKLTTFWAAVVLAYATCFLVLWLTCEVGNLLLQHAFEDECFFELAVRKKALRVLDDEFFAPEFLTQFLGIPLTCSSSTVRNQRILWLPRPISRDGAE